MTKDKERMMARLKRVEGQVRGVSRMVDEDTYCIDVLTQISAATKALQSVAVQLMDGHLRHCVTDAIQSNNPIEADAKIAEAIQVIDRLIKS